MDDLISRQAAIAECNKDYAHGYMYAYCLKQLPSVDAVEVVRCWDCKKVAVGIENGQHYYVCMPRGELVKAQDYCSKGEHKDDG